MGFQTPITGDGGPLCAKENMGTSEAIKNKELNLTWISRWKLDS